VRKLIVLGVLVSGLALTAAGSAVTYGQLDSSRHPEVGGLVGTFKSGTFPYCSGTLVSPTVFLTAAHCDIGVSAVKVTFDSQYTSASTLYSGTYHADPQFGGGQGDAHDIAVVVFATPIPGITPAQLPTAGLLDQMKKDGTLNQGTTFTAVGYGGQERNFDGKGKPVIEYRDAREFAIGSFNSLNKGYIRLSQNQSHGDGGTCYGDSGGPNFLGSGAAETDTIGAITITGDSPCVSTNVDYRLDTASARAFLGRFVTLP
jgi:hypothetical protein